MYEFAKQVEKAFKDITEAVVHRFKIVENHILDLSKVAQRQDNELTECKKRIKYLEEAIAEIYLTGTDTKDK